MPGKEGARVPEQPRSRRKRGSLSAQEIVAAAIHLLDSEGDSALTFARLGQELKAAPTAVYRHFASRSDLVMAIADHLDGISLAGYEPTDDWRVDLEELAWRAWRLTCAHPAAASLMGRVTNGPNELRAVDAILRALHHAGLRGREAVVQYQAYANLVIGTAAAHGARLSAATNGDAGSEWVQAYAPTDPHQYPYAEAARADLRLVDYEEVFATLVRIYLDALALRAAIPAEVSR